MQRNDRIDKVAKKFGMTVSNLREINGLGPTVKIKPGQVLLVRAGGGAAGPTGSAVEPPAKVAAAPAARTVPATAKTTSYVVRHGDTLFGIAKKFGLALDAIKSLNGLKHNRVSVGQLLKLPQ